MDFSTRQDDSRRRWTGLAAVVLFHLLLGWALMNGLARKVADSVSVLVETRIIEAVKPPPPPPPPPVKPATPKPVVAPKAAAPAPKKTEPAPPQRAPVPAALMPMPPVSPPDNAPAPVVREAAPAPAPVVPPRPVGPVAAGIACSRTPPPQAPGVSSEVRGSIFVIGTLKGGRVVQVDVERTSLKGVTDRRVMRAFVQAIETAMKEGYVCVGDDVQIRQEFYFDIR
jgi:protein TonB